MITLRALKTPCKVIDKMDLGEDLAVDVPSATCVTSATELEAEESSEEKPILAAVVALQQICLRR